MKNTRFMERLFSATEEKDEELTSQVAQDIEDAKKNGKVDTEEVTYESNGDGSVSITDKGNGEVTIAELSEDGQYELSPAAMSQQIEGFLHPEGDGVTPGQQMGAPDEHVEEHPGLENGVSQSIPYERSVEEEAIIGPEGEIEEEEVREFSVSTDNSVVLRIFSDQEFCERMFSEVIESEETAIVGDLKIEKVPGEDSVIVTSRETGDQAKVDMEDDTMDVTELDSKNFCCGECGEECGIDGEVEMGDEQYLPLHIVGVDPVNHIIVDSVEYEEDSAQELVAQLAEQGVQALQILPDPDSARDYANSLLQSLGVESQEQLEDPQQVEFSDFENVFVTRYYSDNTDYMNRIFSETVNGIDYSQSQIEDAIGTGDEIETLYSVITPLDASSALIQDKSNGELTGVTLYGDEMRLYSVSEEEALDLIDGLEVGEDRYFSDPEDEEDRNFSDIWCDEEETKFFSEHEEMTDYMVRLFSDESDSEEIEDAIESGEQIETDSEIITPVDANTAVIEDKENGEFTKAVMDDDKLDINPISEEEADELTDGLEVEDTDEDQHDFSDIWCNEEETRFFSEHEEMTDYMVRLFSEEADQDEIEDAIESGEQIENDSEVITPVDANTAVIEDKETGEFTKATIISEDNMDVQAISEEEADELTDGLEVEDTEEEEKIKEFSENNPFLSKFFAEISSASAQEGEDLIAQGQAMIEQGQAMIEQAQAEADGSYKPSVEMVEDKAQAAIQAIQEMTEQAQLAIMEAKEAPVENQEADLREATFTDTNSGIIDSENTALTWLASNMKK